MDAILILLAVGALVGIWISGGVVRYSRKVLSRNTEFGGTLTSGMVPWSDNGIFMAGILGVATLEYLPYMWLAFACIFVTIIFGFTEKFRWSNKNDVRISALNKKIEQ